MGNLLSNDSEYANWIDELCQNYKNAQIKAATLVNIEMLKFYYHIGKGLYEMSQNSAYGSNLIENVSSDLKQRLPNVKSFSPTNLKYMRQYYEFLKNFIKSPQLGDESYNIDLNVKSPQLGDKLNDETFKFFSIPWGHIKIILDKFKNDKERALFYVNETIENNWSRAVLLNFVDTDLYERKGKAISNFNKSLATIDSDLAQDITKDPYCFDFLSIRPEYDEKELKDALMDNIQKFLLELGNGFSFVGREYRLKVAETELYLDMLFYNINLKCYVVVEVKTRSFKPEDMGQLSTYVSCVNHIIKKDDENQTIGILICKNKNNVLAKYAVETQNEPVAISEYELSKLFPKDFKSSMPTIEELENELK